MDPPQSANLQGLENRTFVFLIIAVSLAFAWILSPFFDAILWGTILAILFAPLNRRLLWSMGQRQTAAAFLTVVIVLLIVILPLSLIGSLLVQEALNTFQNFQAGKYDFAGYLQHALDALPNWLRDRLDDFGLMNLASIEEKFSSSLLQGGQFLAGKAFNIGQNTFDFVINLCIVLYLLFFLLRDGEKLIRHIRAAIPLSAVLQRELFSSFTTVIRATVKGNLVVALAQGSLGGLAFWVLGVRAPVLWGVVMTILSLLPAVGSALVWVPVAIYFLLTGAWWRGIALIAFGVCVIGLVDNVLRQILIGKDTKLPDYVVLIATLGGMAIFGIDGFVIGPVIAAMFMAVWGIVASARSSD